MKEYSREEAIKILYRAFNEKGSRLEGKEIISEKKLFSKGELKNTFGTTKTKTIWGEVDSYYKIDTMRTDEQKQELIKEMREMYKIVVPFNNKTVPRVFRNKMERFFGSWVEAMIQSGLKPRSIIPHTLSTERKDLILENLMSITLSERKIPTKSNLNNYKNIPDSKLFKDIYNIEWEDLIIKLDLEKSKRIQFNKLSNNIIFNIFKKEMKSNKSGTLMEYSLNLSDGYPFIYYMERLETNWRYMKLLLSCNFRNVKEERNLVYSKEDLIDVLTFKYLLNHRHLRTNEIDRDIFLLDTNEMITMFGKGMYEIWSMVEENAKTYY